MTDREKVIKGLECCHVQRNEVPPLCEDCPYMSPMDGTCDALDELLGDALTLLKAQELIEARLHLCDSCTKKYPECDAARDGIVFGCGVGNDNIIGCTAYENRWKAKQPRVMTPEEVMSTGPEDVCGIVEIIEEEHMYGCYMRRYDEGHVELLCDVPNLTERLKKGCARIWTARPTDEQRKAAKWDE